jgi:hypothetical protein
MLCECCNADVCWNGCTRAATRVCRARGADPAHLCAKCTKHHDCLYGGRISPLKKKRQVSGNLTAAALIQAAEENARLRALLKFPFGWLKGWLSEQTHSTMVTRQVTDWLTAARAALEGK